MVKNSETSSEVGSKGISSPSNEGITRRQFIKLLGSTGMAILLGPIFKIALDSEFQAGLGAAITRPKMPGSGEIREASLLTLVEVYRKHFKEKEHLLPEKVWVRIEAENAEKKIRGLGAYLGIFANQYYESEKREREDFDTYYKRFVDNLHELSETAGLNFITLITSLQISAENIAGFEDLKPPSNVDVNVSRVQKVGITAARALGMEPIIIESLGIGKLAAQIRKETERRGIKTPLENVIPKEGIRHYDLIRLREQPTTGLMDFEPGCRAEAFMLYQDNPLSLKLQREYPQVCERYKKAHEKREKVSEIRREMELAAKNFIERYKEAFRPFAEGDINALSVIGISQDLDLWQLINYTDVWYKASEIPTNPEFAYQRTVEYIKQEAKKDPQAFYKRLFSQQIRNKKFINYLKRYSITNNNREMLSAVLDIQDLVERYEQKAKDLRIAHNNILEAEGKYEYDSRFQQTISVLVTKQLSDLAGNFDPNNRESLGWHIYKTCAAREIAPIPFLVDSQPFACDITIDPPYAPEAIVESLDKFARMLQEAGILEAAPDKDIYAWYNTMEKMFWRDGGVWFGEKLNPENQLKWTKILEHFNTSLAIRLFYDFAGLLHDQQKMDELNKLLINKKIITKSANEDPYNFFTQFVYLALNSRHMRRDILEADWNEVEKYFQNNIMPMVIIKEEVSPGVYKNKWNIGSADYPPIFRSQAVMYNFLFDRNPIIPSSTSSSELLGHH